jgi:hypothetical protein
MDLSKLPKLSKTQEQLSAEPTPVEPAVKVAPVAPSTGGSHLGEAWLSIGVGAFLLFFEPRFLQWASSRLFHTAFNEFLDGNGAVVPYPTVPEFWSDLGITLFGLVLILDGILLFTHQRTLVWIAFALTVITTALNLWWMIGSYSTFGFAPISFLAVIFGGYIASSQWRILQLNRHRANY